MERNIDRNGAAMPRALRKVWIFGDLIDLHDSVQLAAIDVDVPMSQIPARFEPEVFFLEIASPWSGTLDLRNDETRKAVESYRQRK